MRRTALLAALLAACLSVAAQGWRYDKPNMAYISSSPLFLSGDFEKPTVLAVGVAHKNGADVAIGMLIGDCEMCDFRDSQQYVVISFDYEAQRKIPIAQTDNGKYNIFVFKDYESIVKQFKACDEFVITMPVYGHGVQTFIFSADGYPLDW